MDLLLKDEFTIIYISSLLGLMFGFYWDIGLILRKFWFKSTIATCVIDIIFFSIYSLISCTYILSFNDGTIRYYIVLFNLVGFIIYKRIASKIILKIISFILARIIIFCKAIKKVIIKVLKRCTKVIRVVKLQKNSLKSKE